MTTYRVLDESFRRKDDIVQRVRGILDRAPLDRELPANEAAFMIALLTQHPHANIKLGCGVESIIVRRNSRFFQREFWLRRTDGSETDFSYRECIRPSSQRQNLNAALRAEIAGQIIAFKEGVFANTDTVPCPITGEILTWHTTHIDHAAPDTFAALAEEFITARGLAVHEIKLIESQDGVTGTFLADPVLREEWRDFHDTRARLRAVSIEANTRILTRRTAA